MEPAEIPQHKVEPDQSSETPIIRAHTPQLLISLIVQGALENIESVSDIASGSVTALEGGVSSACYFMENNGQPVVVKFRSWGVDAEAEALNAWRNSGASVPEVKSKGVVQLEIGTKNPIKYLVLEGIVDEQGKIAPTANKLEKAEVDLLAELGRQMGHQLYLMHQAVSEQPFGGIADLAWQISFETWNQYLSQTVEINKDYLLSIGIPDKSISAMLTKMLQINFPAKGSYIHNDFGLHNVLIEKTDPLKIRVFDPNPLIGDPYFDLAEVFRKLDFQRIITQANNPDNPNPPWLEKNRKIADALISTYVRDTGQELDHQRLQANLIGTTIPKIVRYEKNDNNNLNEVTGKRELLKDYIAQLIQN